MSEDDVLTVKGSEWAIVPLTRWRNMRSKMAAAEAVPQLRQWLGVLLDQVDYTSGACAPTEMVGACLPRDVIEKSRAVLESTRK